MKILYIGNFSEHLNGERYYDLNRKLCNGFVRLGHSVYQYSDRDIARASTIFHSRKFGVVPANRRLVAVAQNFRPDLIVIGASETVWNSTLRRIRADLKSVRMAYFNVDPLFDDTNVKKIMRRAEVADSIFVTTAGDVLKQFIRPWNTVCFMPNCVDASIETNQTFRRTDLDYDLVYAIGGPSSRDARVALIRALTDALPQIQFDVRGALGIDNVFGAAYQVALDNARMGLNYSRQNDHYLYSSDRMAQYMGNGLLTLIPRSTGFADIYTDNEIVFFDSFEDIVDKILYYAANDDKARNIAENGWRKTHQIFNEKLVARYLIEVTFREKLFDGYRWPTDNFSEGTGGSSAQPFPTLSSQVRNLC